MTVRPRPLSRHAAMPAQTGTRHTVSIRRVADILRVARRRGVDVAQLLRRARIPAVLLAHSAARVSQAQFLGFLRALRRATRDDFLGLCSRPLPIGSFAWGCRALARCDTVGDALREGLAYYRFLLPDFAPRLRVSEGVARLQLHSLVPARRRADLAERLFLFFAYGVACFLARRKIPLLRVGYRGVSSGSASDLPRLYDAPMHYGQPCNGLAFEARWLGLPVVQDPHALREFLRDAPANLPIRFTGPANATERIRRYLHRHLRGELPSLVDVARALGTTPQTLHRRLAAEGQHFSALKDDLRRDAAIAYLARHDIGIAEVAQRLGFSEPSTFHRAFKKWTGVPPGAYRSALAARQAGR